MTERPCINCNAPTEETYELLLRGNQHTQTPLCDACYTALQQELPLED